MHSQTRSTFRYLPMLLTLAAFAGPMGYAQAIFTAGTVNSADYSRSFAPGAMISIFGTKLATGTAQATSFPMPNSLLGTSVSVGVIGAGQQIPLFYVSPGQINAQLPFNVSPGPLNVTVTTPSGVTNSDSIVLAVQAPKFFTLDFSGAGTAVATTPTYSILTSQAPAMPASMIVLWMNSMGPVNGNPVAGQPAPGATAGSQPATLVSAPNVTVNGQAATVTYAGLAPGMSGLYQLNIQAPFVVLTGPVSVQVSVGGVGGVGGGTTQANVTIPYQQSGFYSALLGGKAVSGQTLNGVSGSTSALALRQTDPISWGTNGLNAWTNNTGLGSTYSVTPGLAITLQNGSSIVYDNNGIETGTAGTFYNNTGGPSNDQKPGLSDFYSMSNYFPAVYAGYFKLAQSTTITRLTGYFDALLSAALPFDPANPFIKYRMNIWSMASGVPGANSFVGNVFTSDTTAGTFSYSDTGLRMLSNVKTDFPKVIYRLTYTLNTPLTLPAGEYWFSHDASIRASAAVGANSTANAIRASSLAEYISRQNVDSKTYLFNFFGREMQLKDSWVLPEAVEVHPDSTIGAQ